MTNQIDTEQFNKILKYINEGKNSGAKLETGGNKLGSKGYYIQPTVFSNVKVSFSFLSHPRITIISFDKIF